MYTELLGGHLRATLRGASGRPRCGRPRPAVSAPPPAPLPRGSAGPLRGGSPALPSAHKRLFPTSHVSTSAHGPAWPLSWVEIVT